MNHPASALSCAVCLNDWLEWEREHPGVVEWDRDPSGQTFMDIRDYEALKAAPSFDIAVTIAPVTTNGERYSAPVCARHFSPGAKAAPLSDADAGTVDCQLAHPVGKDEALAWASTTEWFFKSYYKYGFTFESSGFLAMPDEHEAHEFTATATVGGDAPDIYRFKVEDTEPMTWDEISYAGVPCLTIRDQDGTELITVAGDEA